MNKKVTAVISIIAVISVLLTSVLIYAEGEGADTSETSVSVTEDAETQPTEAPSSTETTTAKPKKKPFTGWKTTKKGNKRYYKKGKLVKHKIIKIGKSKYCFNKKGYMVSGKSYKIGKKTYYLAKNGKLRAYKKGKTYYKKNGKKMNKAQKEDWKTRLTAEKLVDKITTDDMSKKEKLKVCFNWVMKKPYIQYRKFRPTAYWPATYANDHFLRRGGDCHADGSALAYLAVAIGYKNVYVCNDCNGIRAQGHSWCEINGKVYDPLFAQAKNYNKYYGATYKSYRLYPVLHIKMDYNKSRPKR